MAFQRCIHATASVEFAGYALRSYSTVHLLKLNCICPFCAEPGEAAKASLAFESRSSMTTTVTSTAPVAMRMEQPRTSGIGVTIFPGTFRNGSQLPLICQTIWGTPFFV